MLKRISYVHGKKMGPFTRFYCSGRSKKSGLKFCLCTYTFSRFFFFTLFFLQHFTHAPLYRSHTHIVIVGAVSRKLSILSFQLALAFHSSVLTYVVYSAAVKVIFNFTASSLSSRAKTSLKIPSHCANLCDGSDTNRRYARIEYIDK